MKILMTLIGLFLGCTALFMLGAFVFFFIDQYIG